MSNGEVIKYHKFISVVVIELSVRCLNTGPEDRLFFARKDSQDFYFFSSVCFFLHFWQSTFSTDPCVRFS